MNRISTFTKNKFYIIICAIVLLVWGGIYYIGSYCQSVYIVVALLILITSIFLHRITSRPSFDPKHLAMLVIFLGTAYSFILPACSVPDEDFHFTNAYKVSNYLMYGTGIESQTDTISMRKDDSNRLTRAYYNYDFIDYYKSPVFVEDNLTVVNNVKRDNTSAYSYPYFLAGITITICRILHLGSPILMFLGREINLLFFAFCAFISLKNIPYYKNSLIAIFLFPMTLITAASFSYDSFNTSMIILFASFVYKMIYSTDRVQFIDLLMSFLTYVLFTPIKIVYCVMIILCMLIKKDKFVHAWRKNVYVVSMLLSAFMLSMLTHGEIVKFLLSRQVYSAETYIEAGQVIIEGDEIVENSSDAELEYNPDTGELILSDRKWTVSDVIHHPINVVRLLLRTIFDNFELYVLNMIGYYYGWFTYKISIIYSLIILVILLLSAFGEEIKPENSSNNMYYGGVWMLCILLILGTMLLAETYISMKTLNGVQGRYFIPVVILAVYAFGNRFKACSISRKNIVLTISFVNFIVMLQILNEVMCI